MARAKVKQKVKAPTVQEVAAEIVALKEMKPYVRQHSAFGDDNHAAMDAQIDVLEKLHSYDEIYDLYKVANVMDAAIDAREWLDRGEGKMSESWRCLDRRVQG